MRMKANLTRSRNKIGPTPESEHLSQVFTQLLILRDL